MAQPWNMYFASMNDKAIVSDLIDNVTIIIVRVDGDVPAPLAAANA